jgi:hypothetical protein
MMTPWTKVVTHPLGLAGFVLFLVFGYLARSKRRDEHRWLAPVAFAIAAAALIGGLILAYVEVPKPVPPAVQISQPPPPVQQQTNQKVQQTSTGKGSPNVQGVQGDVTITVDQSTGKTTTQKTSPAKEPQQKSK